MSETLNIQNSLRWHLLLCPSKSNQSNHTEQCIIFAKKIMSCNNNKYIYNLCCIQFIQYDEMTIINTNIATRRRNRSTSVDFSIAQL